MIEFPIKPFKDLHVGNPRTQKAQGLQALIREYRNTPFWGNLCVPFTARNTLLVTELDQIDIDNATEIFRYLRGLAYPKEILQFIRPCPITPKHGFVESRIFDNPQTLVDTARETIEADSLGEILIMQYIPAEYSSVINPNCITIGRGTDGVTSGKEDTITFSTFRRRQAPWNCPSFTVLAKQNALACEALWLKDRKQWAVVQMREISSKIGTARTCYIPKDFQVAWIIRVAHLDPNSLMERLFDKITPQEAETTFFVVNTMQSHNAMQLIEKGYAVGEKSLGIVFGDKLKKTSDEILPFMTKDLEDLALLLRGYMSKSMRTLTLNSASTGNTGMVTGRQLLARWAAHTAKDSLSLDLSSEGDRIVLSLGIVSMLYMSISACTGEARHFFFKGTGGMSYAGLPHRIFKADGVMKTYPKEVVYEKLDDYKLPQLLAVASRVLPMLDATWASGYGGAAWSKILTTNLSMYEEIKQFIEAPTSKTLISLLNKYNEASYLTHNGGAGALSKFGAVGRTDMEILGDIGIGVLNNPPLRKKGKLPRFRESTLPPKMSHKREWPPFGELEHPNAILRVNLQGLSVNHYVSDYDPTPVPYVILLSDIDWRESNSPWGFLISGLICLDTEVSNALNARFIRSVLRLKGIIFFKEGWKTNDPSPSYGNLENVQILRKKYFKRKYILDALPHNIAYCTRQYYLSKGAIKQIPMMFNA